MQSKDRRIAQGLAKRFEGMCRRADTRTTNAGRQMDWCNLSSESSGTCTRRKCLWKSIIKTKYHNDFVWLIQFGVWGGMFSSVPISTNVSMSLANA